jgi:hypothetical protein
MVGIQITLSTTTGLQDAITIKKMQARVSVVALCLYHETITGYFLYHVLVHSVLVSPYLLGKQTTHVLHHFSTDL